MADDTQITPTSQQAGTTSGKIFNIPDEVVKRYSDLVEMIKNSASMNDDERQYWFSILPIMTEEQVERLRNILQTEKQKLSAIDAKYQQELAAMNEKHLLEWQETKRKEKRQEIEQQEQASQKDDEDEAEKLLSAA